MTRSTARRTNPAGTGKEAPTGVDRAQDRDTSVGAGLRRAREARGIALRDLAESTKLSVSALEAIERDDLRRLPGGIFTRAFVRTYAQAVGLHPDQTLDAFLAQAPETAIETGALRAPQVPAEPPADSSGGGGAAWRAITALAVPVLVVVLYVVLRPASEEPALEFERRPLHADRVHALEIDTPAPIADTPAAWTDSGLVHAVNQTGGLTVVLEPRRICWLAATLDGAPRISRLLAAGEQITLEAEREIVLKLGDAGAVSITVNGEPIRMLGDSGQVVTARIAQDNVGEYLATP